jgi:hypothetical protein
MLASTSVLLITPLIMGVPWIILVGIQAIQTLMYFLLVNRTLKSIVIPFILWPIMASFITNLFKSFLILSTTEIFLTWLTIPYIFLFLVNILMAFIAIKLTNKYNNKEITTGVCN